MTTLLCAWLILSGDWTNPDELACRYARAMLDGDRATTASITDRLFDYDHAMLPESAREILRGRRWRAE